MSKGTPKRWSPEAEAKILEAWDARTPFLKASEFDRAHAKAHKISTGVMARKRCELIKARKADAWTKDWPTEPGWYWIRALNGGVTEVARVLGLGPGGRDIVHLFGGEFAHPRNWPDVLWGPRIPEPEVSP